MQSLHTKRCPASGIGYRRRTARKAVLGAQNGPASTIFLPLPYAPITNRDALSQSVLCCHKAAASIASETNSVDRMFSPSVALSAIVNNADVDPSKTPSLHLWKNNFWGELSLGTMACGFLAVSQRSPIRAYLACRRDRCMRRQLLVLHVFLPVLRAGFPSVLSPFQILFTALVFAVHRTLFQNRVNSPSLGFLLPH